jgi:co-chaperonin GroES (HSP10)
MIKSLIGDKILVEILEAEKQTASGIFIPAGVSKKEFKAKVLMIGPKTKHIKKDDIIKYYEHCGINVSHNNKESLVLKESTEVIAIL